MGLWFWLACSGVEPPADDDGDGYNELAGDCDDSDPAVSPAAADVCDGRDNDCDGEVDEDSGPTDLVYVDQDGDGYGDPGTFLASCAGEPGHVADSTDCDDQSAAAHPGAEEVCGDGLDNDCDGRPCAPTGEAGLSAADASFVGSDHPNFGSALVMLGDDDGDGHRTLAIGARAWSGVLWPVEPLPYVWLFDGPFAGSVTAEEADGIIDGIEAHESNAPAVLLPMDVGGDGVEDLVLGAPGDLEGSYPLGGFYVARGPFGAETTVGPRIEGELYYDHLGTALAALDLDGDGVDELVAGAPAYAEVAREHPEYAELADQGLVRAYDGLDLAAWGAKGDALAYTQLRGPAPGSRFGSALATLGDTDGDGYDELAVGAPGPTTGAVYVYSGPLPRSPETALVVLLGPEDGAALGASLAAGVVDGDGVDDLVIGAPGESTDSPLGEVWVVSGGAWGGGTSVVGEGGAGGVVEGGGVQAGSAVAPPADVDGDGVADLLYGIPRDGRARLQYDPFGGGDHLLILGTAAADGVGSSVLLGDVDGNGLAEVIAGDPAGRVVLAWTPSW